MTPARGRPLRFLATVTVGWVGMRVALLWPEGLPPGRWVRIVLPGGQGVAVAPAVAATQTVGPVRRVVRAPSLRPAVVEAAAVVHDPDRVELALLAPVGFGPVAAVEPEAPPILLPPVATAAGPRMTVSLWAMARPGVASGGPVQLGGGQAGLRVRMPVTASGRAAVTARVATLSLIHI